MIVVAPFEGRFGKLPFKGRWNSLLRGRWNSLLRGRWNSLLRGRFGIRKAGAG